MQGDDNKRKSDGTHTPENPGKVQKVASGRRFIASMIGQWSKRVGIDCSPVLQTQSFPDATSTTDLEQKYIEAKRRNQVFQKRLQTAEETISSLTVSLKKEIATRDEISAKLNTTWESIDTITSHCNSISETLTGYRQHHTTLSALYDNVIVTQSTALEDLRAQFSNMAGKNAELKVLIGEAENRLKKQEERLKTIVSQNEELRIQLENQAAKFSAEKNHLINTHAEEKLLTAKILQEKQSAEQEKEQLHLQLVEIQKEQVKVTAFLDEKENSISKMRKEIVTYKEEIKNLLFNNEDLSKKYNELITEKDIITSEMESKVKEARCLQEKVDEVKQREHDVIERINSYEKRLSDEINRSAKFQDDLVSMEKKVQETELRNMQLETLKNTEIGIADTAMADLKNRIQSLEEEKEVILSENRAYAVEQQQIQENFNHAKERERELTKQIHSYEERFTSEVKLSSKLRCDVAEVEKKLQEVELRNEKLESLKRNEKSMTDTTIADLKKKIKSLQKEKETILWENQKNAQVHQELQKNAAEIKQNLMQSVHSYETKLTNEIEQSSKLRCNLEGMEKKLEEVELQNVELQSLKRTQKYAQQLQESTDRAKQNKDNRSLADVEKKVLSTQKEKKTSTLRSKLEAQIMKKSQTSVKTPSQILMEKNVSDTELRDECAKHFEELKVADKMFKELQEEPRNENKFFKSGRAPRCYASQKPNFKK